MRLFNYQDFSLTKTNRFVNRRFTFYENNGHQKQQEKAKLHGQEFSSLNWIAKGSDNCAVIWSATRSNLEHLTRIVLEKPILPASPSHMCTRQNDIRPLKRRQSRCYLIHTQDWTKKDSNKQKKDSAKKCWFPSQITQTSTSRILVKFTIASVKAQLVLRS